MAKKKNNGSDENALSQPFLNIIDDNTLRIRRNLLIISGFALFYLSNNLSISEQSSFLGLKFDNLSIDSVNLAIFLIILYQTLHFSWNIIDSIFQSRLKVTGNKVRYITVGRFADSKIKDYPDDPNQSTLYNWWNEKLRELSSLKKTDVEQEIKSIKESQKELIALIESNLPEPEKSNIIRNLQTKVSNLDQRLNTSQIAQPLEKALEILESQRIEKSLERFDKWFFCYQKQQLVRIFLIEIGFPLGLSLYSIYKIWEIL